MLLDLGVNFDDSVYYYKAWAQVGDKKDQIWVKMETDQDMSLDEFNIYSFILLYFHLIMKTY